MQEFSVVRVLFLIRFLLLRYKPMFCVLLELQYTVDHHEVQIPGIFQVLSSTVRIWKRVLTAVQSNTFVLGAHVFRLSSFRHISGKWKSFHFPFQNQRKAFWHSTFPKKGKILYVHIPKWEFFYEMSRRKFFNFFFNLSLFFHRIKKKFLILA